MGLAGQGKKPQMTQISAEQNVWNTKGAQENEKHERVGKNNYPGAHPAGVVVLW